MDEQKILNALHRIVRYQKQIGKLEMEMIAAHSAMERRITNIMKLESELLGVMEIVLTECERELTIA